MRLLNADCYSAASEIEPGQRGHEGGQGKLAFVPSQSALMLVCARLPHVASTGWGAKRYMRLKHLNEAGITGLNPVAG